MKKKQHILRISLFILIVEMFILYSANTFGAIIGDIDGSEDIDLRDAISAIQICAGMKPSSDTNADVNNNGKIGLEEAIFAIQVLSGIITIWYKDSDGDGYSDGTVLFSADRPSDIYYKASELIATRGDKNDNIANIHPETQELTYSLPSLQLTTITGYNGNVETIISNTPKSDYIGKPVLPVIPATVVLPAGHEFDHIEIEPGEKITLPGTHTVEHGQQPYPLLPDIEPLPTLHDPAVYSSDSPYPGKLYDMAGVQKLSGVSILMVNLNPVEYKPLSGQISYYKTLSLKVITNPEIQKQRNNKIRYRPSLVPLHLKVDNPETLSTYTDLPYTDLPYMVKSPITAGLCDPSETYRYVLITGKEIRDASTNVSVNDLIVHRRAQGISATIVTVEDIYGKYPGVDKAEQVRNFIIDAFNCWETEFVLLGGDVNIVPMRKLWCVAWPGSVYQDHIPSDLYYQCLDGNYNSDGDNQWGEPIDGDNGGDIDLLAELYVGRASAENATEMSNFVYKTLTFENNNSDYKKRVLLCGELLWKSSDTYGKEYMEEIRSGASTHGYTTAGFAADPAYTADVLYDKDSVWSKNAVTGKISSDNYSIINHLGHSNYDYVMRMHNPDADALDNSNFIFAYSQGCIPGNFEEDCIGEHLTTSTRGGMFAVVFNSRYGWGAHGSTDGKSQRYNREFWDAFFNENIVRLGIMNADSHEDNAWRINEPCMRWCYYESNLLGDPATSFVKTTSCDCRILPASQSFPSTGGTGSVSVTALSSCNWNTTNNDPGWITITSGSSGNGNGTVNYSVASCSGAGSRTGTVTIEGNNFTVTQECRDTDILIWDNGNWDEKNWN